MVTAARRGSARRLALWMNGERVGTWSQLRGADELSYDSSWIGSPAGRPLSLSLPFTPDGSPHRGPAVTDWFENLLPETRALRDRLASRFGAASTGAFDLLEQVGRDCVGALQIVPDDADPGDVRRLDAESLDEEAVARLLDRTMGGARADDGSPDDLRISLAGAQEKTALLWHEGRWWLPRGATPTTHILKLPLGLVGGRRVDMTHSVDNEWLCAQIAASCELPAARCHPLQFGPHRVLGVERFDRRWSPDGTWLLRLPQEDLCQATATAAHRKYEADGGPGIEACMRVLAGSVRPAADRQAFFLAQVLFWMLRAPDGHAKNFSIALRAGGAYSLAPLYDVLSFAPILGDGPNQVSAHQVRLAMAVRTRNVHWKMRDVRRSHWVELGRRYGIGADTGVEALLDDFAATVGDAVERVLAGLPGDFPARVAERTSAVVAEASRVLVTRQ